MFAVAAADVLVRYLGIAAKAIVVALHSTTSRAELRRRAQVGAPRPLTQCAQRRHCWAWRTMQPSTCWFLIPGSFTTAVAVMQMMALTDHAFMFWRTLLGTPIW